MSDVTTPVRTPFRKDRTLPPVSIPPSPFLKKLGYGTGVAVYKLERSPIANQCRSPWAIKKLLNKNIVNSHYGERLKTEASILRQLNHPHIVGFRAFVRNKDDQDCLAMEECNNCLGDMIEDRRALDAAPAYPVKHIMKVALDISEALNYLHTQALLLHADVKSYNILVKDNFTICKLCDFGVALPLTPTGKIDFAKAGDDAEYEGTRLWSAPEVLIDPQAVTAKTDIYSYGLVLWEMLSLTPPCLDTLNDVSIASSMDNSISDFADNSITSDSAFGKRPELPPQEFDDSYKYVLEIFHCCTEQDPMLRPSAQDLTISIPAMIKELHLDAN